jgi:hypothetical protein
MENSPVLVPLVELREMAKQPLLAAKQVRSPEGTVARCPKLANSPVRANRVRDSLQSPAMLAALPEWQLDRLALAFFWPTR